MSEALLERTVTEQPGALRAARPFLSAAVFLLALKWENLFERVGGVDSYTYRCKGCQATLRFTQRERHFNQHRRQLDAGKLVIESEPATTAKEEPMKAAPEATVVNDKPKVAPKPRANKTDVSKRDTSASKAISDKLVEKLSKDIKGITTTVNDKVGYVTVKKDGKTIGYNWLTTKDDLRVEFAIQMNDVPEALLPDVVACNRSEIMAVRGRIQDNADGFKLAVALLKLAAKKVGAK